MICAASNDSASFEYIDAWRSEIESSNPGKPVVLNLIHRDTTNLAPDQTVTEDMMARKCKKKNRPLSGLEENEENN